MIKFIHRKHAEREKGTAKIIITYTFFEIVLGLLLLFTNISAMIIIFNSAKKYSPSQYSVPVNQLPIPGNTLPTR